ncbi:MAG TPA: histidinol-phosphate transaminase [Thermodesulfobacteriota bacterium]|nr:histidinol-phosphate transaminase [Thermodesulfobacteriota bacterium]
MKIKKSIRDLIPYPPGKPIEELTREYGIKKVIKLASNENPLGPSPQALKAIRKGLSQLHRYPDGSGYYLKEGLSRQLGVKSDQILLGNGSNEIIELALRTFLSPGDEVISPSPSFLVYGTAVQAVEGKNILVPLKRFIIDLEAMLQAISPRTRIIIVNNPNNPTGTIIKRKGWKRFLRAVPPDILVLLDEAYIDFVDDPDCPDGLEYLASDKPLLVLRTFSKAYGLAGLRVGYGVTRADLADYMNRVRQPFNVNSLGQAGALGALEDREFFEKTRSLVREGKLTLEKGLKKLGLTYIPTQTNFLLIKVPGKAQEIFEAMLHKGVIIRSMKSYGLENYIRVNMGLPEENRLFLKALEEVLAV